VQIVDANVLVNAVNRNAADHDVARDWLERALVGDSTLGFAWVVMVAFLRISTNPAALADPLDADLAGRSVEGWLGEDASVVVDPTSRHLAVLRRLLSSNDVSGNLVNDAHLAALAIEHDAAIVSFDRDFSRFEGVTWVEPE
jgi:toxin-antitoxin system PIN domain toxin